MKLRQLLPGLLLGGSLLLGGCGAKSPADAEQALAAGKRQLATYDFQAAYDSFTAAQRAATAGSVTWMEASFGLATCAQHSSPPRRELIEQATRLYEQLATPPARDADSAGAKFAGRALLNLGRLAELRDYPGDEPDLAAARKYYEQVAAGWPNHELGDEATLRLAGLEIQQYEKLETVRAGAERLEAWLARRPDSPLAATGWAYLADTYFQPLADYPKMLVAFQHADELGLPNRSTAGKQYWRMALILEEELQQPRRAVAFYQKIIRITPTSGRAYESQQALRRLSQAHPDWQIEIPRIMLFRTSETEAAP